LYSASLISEPVAEGAEGEEVIFAAIEGDGVELGELTFTDTLGWGEGSHASKREQVARSRTLDFFIRICLTFREFQTSI
jgi:hypothetical protein